MGQKVCPADVISLCEADGRIRPLRVRFIDEEQIYRKMNIDHILRRDHVNFVGAEAELFLCQTSFEGKRWLIRLKYSLRNHSWCITERLY